MTAVRPKEIDADAVLETTLLDGALHLRQLKAGHRAGTDAILLSACISGTAGTVLDVGAGAGAAGLAVAQRNRNCQLLLAEIEPALAAIARENVALNGMDGRARVVAVDILSSRSRAAAQLPDHCADVLITNPPYQLASASRVSPDPLKARAHTLAAGDDGAQIGLDKWLRACAALLKPGGTFALIHRADALADVMAACAGRFGALQIMPVHPKAGRAAHRILVRGTAGSRGPVSILPGLILHQEDGQFMPRAAAVHAGQETLNFQMSQR